MKCKFCREEIPEGARMCPLCGAAVDSAEMQTEQEAPVQNDEQDKESFQYHNSGVGQTANDIGQAPLNGTLYMVLSVLATLLCCLPFGIIGIVFSSRINFQQRNGDYEGARVSAKMAERFLVLSLVLGLIVGFAAMSFFSSDGIGIGLPNDVLEPYNEMADDSDDMNTPPEDLEDGMDGELDGLADDVKPAKRVSKLGKNWDSYTVQVNGKVIALPCEYKDLEAAGLGIDEGLGMHKEDAVAARGYLIGYLGDEKGNSMTVEFINPDKTKKKAVECLVGSITVGDYDLKEGGLSVVFPGGVQMGTAKAEVAEKYGEPEEAYEGESLHTYMWTDSESYLSSVETYFNPETLKLVQMTMKNYGDEKGNEN